MKFNRIKIQYKDLTKCVICANGCDAESNGESSAIHFALDELVELFPTDALSSESSHRVDDLHQLLITVAVSQLLVDVAQIVQIQLALSLNVQQSEVGLPALLRKGVALSHQTLTMRVVSSFKNCSKSKALPLVESCTSWSSLKTNSYLVSSPSVPAVRRNSRISARLCLGSAQREKRACNSAMLSVLKMGFLAPMSLARMVLSSLSWISFLDIVDIMLPINYNSIIDARTYPTTFKISIFSRSERKRWRRGKLVSR